MADDTNSQAPPTEGAASENGFGEAFAERSKDPAGERDTGAEAGAEEAPAAGGEGSATADQPGAASQGAANEGSGTKAPAFDPYAGLTPEQKSHFERLASSERSQRGRVGALTKKLNSFGRTQQPPAGETGSQARSDDSGDGNSGSTTGEPTAAEIEAQLKTITDEYGDIVGPLPKLVTALTAKIDRLEASATRHQVNEDAEALAQAYGALESAHPDYAEVAADPKFREWLGSQSGGIQSLANSYDPSEVSLALQLFKTESGAA